MIKKILFSHCKAHLEKKIEILELQKKSLQKDLTSEIKSSVGDKHETGRAMIQLELEKLGNQIHKIELNYQRLNTIKDFKTSSIVSFCLLYTSDAADE